MHNLNIYKKLIKGFQESDPEKIKFILENVNDMPFTNKQTKLQYLNKLKDNMYTDICDWQRWYSKLNILIDKEND
jgi:hypothetical protein